MSTRLLIVGDVGSQEAFHVGDEAMLIALIDEQNRLAESALEWTIVSNDPEFTASRSGLSSVRLFGFAGLDSATRDEWFDRICDLEGPLTETAQWRQTLDALDRCDILVIAGGGNLVDAWPEHIYERVALSRRARARGIPVVVSGQSVGPELNDELRPFVEELLQTAVVVGVREESSAALVRSLGVTEERLHCVIDDATMLRSTQPPDAVTEPYIAVTLEPHGLVTWPESEDALVEQLVRIATTTNLRLVFVPHVGSVHGPESIRLSDVATSQRIASKIASVLGVEGVLVAQLPTPQEAKWWSEHARFVISSRYHPIVFACASMTPSIFIAQDNYTMQKGRGVLGLYGLEAMAISWDTAVASLADLTLQSIARRHAVKATLATSTDQLLQDHSDFMLRVSDVIGQKVMVPRRVAGTIVARNYLAQARVLARSFIAAHPDVPFFTLIIDGKSDGSAPEGSSDVTIDQLPLPAHMWHRMATIYSVTEFSTSLKPSFLKFLLAKGVDQAWYLDPDIFVFDSLVPVTRALQHSPIALTPHVVTPIPRDGLSPNEASIKHSGIYNLGFIGVTPDADAFLTWWQERLLVDALSDVAETLFTDQRWVDFAPALFNCSILRHPGLNVAYWNLHERAIRRGRNGELLSNEQPLLFFHFSGYSPKFPHDVASYVIERPRVTFGEYPHLREVFAKYAAALHEEGFLDRIGASYGYGVTAGGIVLDTTLRRAYREAWMKSADEGPPDPFVEEEHDDFVAWVNDDLGPYWSLFTPAQRTLWGARRDLQGAFPDPFGISVHNYLSWLCEDPQVETDVRRDALVAREKLAKSLPMLESGGWNVVGYHRAELGVGEAGRRVADAIMGTGIPFELVAVDASLTRQGHPLKRTISRRARFRNSIVAVNADQVAPVMHTLGLLPEFVDRRVGVWFWELERFPERWHSAFNYFDEIWAASNFMCRAFSRNSPIPVRHLTLEIPVRDQATPLQRSDVGFDDRFTFLVTFDFNSIARRKNPNDVVDAYRRAFSSGGRTRLVIRSINGGRHRREFEALAAQAEGREDITVADRWLTASEARAQIELADCYVSLHRAEGFGLNMATAFATATPVLATAYSGNMDYMNDANSWLVPFDLTPVGPGAAPYDEDQMWAQPRIDDAASIMKMIVEHRDEARTRAERAREQIRDSHSSRAAANCAHALMSELTEREMQ